MLVSGPQSGLKPGFLLDGVKIEKRLSKPDATSCSNQTIPQFEEGRFERGDRGEMPTREILAMSVLASQPSCLDIGSTSASIEWKDPEVSFPTVYTASFSFEVDLQMVRHRCLKDRLVPAR